MTDFNVFSLLRLQISISIVAGHFCEPLPTTVELERNRQILVMIPLAWQCGYINFTDLSGKNVSQFGTPVENCQYSHLLLALDLISVLLPSAIKALQTIRRMGDCTGFE